MKTQYILTLAFTLTSIALWAQSIITIREICVEDCTDGVDGDNDGLSDCQDMDCIDYFKQQFLFKSNSDSTYCNIDVIQDTIVTWSDCIDILIAGIINTTAIPRCSNVYDFEPISARSKAYYSEVTNFRKR